MTKAQHTACRWKAWTLKIHRKIKLRLRLKRKKEHLLSYTKLPTPYTRRAGPGCPSTAGVSVPTTENGYCSLWQGKGSPVTQNIKFPPHYAETSLCTAYLTSVSHPSVWFKAVYHHVSIQKAWVKPNRECSPSALPRQGGTVDSPSLCGVGKSLTQAGFSTPRNAEVHRNQEIKAKLKPKEEFERQEVKMNVIIQDSIIIIIC